MRPGLLERGHRGGDVLARSFNSGGIGLEAGDGFVAGLGTRNSLLRKRNGARGIGSLVIEIGLSLGKRCLSSAHLRLRGGGGAGDFALALALGLNGLVELVLVAGDVGQRSFFRCREVVALDDGNEIALFDLLPFLNVEGLDAAGDPGADEHFVGVDGADELEVTRSMSVE